jgi:predicted DNA-binding protein
MHMYSERTQVLLSPEQLARLKRLAAREGKSVGAVIREAVDAFVGAEPDKRRRALEALFAMEAPVDDWEVMKAEIERGRYPDLYPEPES